MGSQSSKLVNESQQRKEHLVQLSGTSSSQTSAQQFSVKKEPNLVNTLFKWGFGGSVVYVTGTFSNWKDHIQLQKQGSEFSIYVRLPPGIHQYKFIVDGEWRFSPDDNQSFDENGNINNIIDTTNSKPSENTYLRESHQRPIPPIEQRKRKMISSFDEHFDKLTIKPANHQKNAFELQSEKYGLSNPQTTSSAFPEFQFASKAPMCPPHLSDIYFLRQREQNHLSLWRAKKTFPENTKQEDIEKQNTIDKNEIFVNLFDGDHSLAPPQHVTTSHVGIKKMKNNGYNVYCITLRFKQKYSTFKFFTSQYVEGADKLFLA